MVFSVMLWMPSWGGMINGLMTLSGAWEKLRTDPSACMMVVSVAFYGMSTSKAADVGEGGQSLSHYTDGAWHVHSESRLGRLRSFGRSIAYPVDLEQEALLA